MAPSPALVRGWAVALLVLLLLGNAVPATGSSYPSMAAERSVQTTPAPAHSDSTRSTPPLLGSPGSVARTVFLNYNASWSGNFLSTVSDWSIGPGAWVPSTGFIWLSDLPKPDAAGPLPRLAPAVLFDPQNLVVVGIVPELANTSDLAYDSADGLLFASNPINNTVGVFDPLTLRWTHTAIPVGLQPTNLTLDIATGDLFVANSGSANLSVIDTTTLRVIGTGIPTGSGPVSMSLDETNQTLFVACDNSSHLNVVNATTFAYDTNISLPGHAGGVAYSEATNTVAVTIPALGFMTILNATSLFTTFGVVNVGRGVTAVAATSNYSYFLAANTTGSNLVEVNPLNGSGWARPSFGIGPSALYMAPGPASPRTIYIWCSGSRNLVYPGNGTTVPAFVIPTLGASPDAFAFDPANNVVVVADGRNDSIGFLSPTNGGRVSGPVWLPASPLSLASDSSNGWIYVGMAGGVAALDAASETIVVSNYSLTGDAEALQVDTADHLLWELNSLHGLVAYSLSNLTLTLSPGIGSGQTGIRNLALDQVTDQLYLPINNSGTSYIGVVNASTGALVNGSVELAPNLTSLTFDPADNDVYALGDNVSVVNASSLTAAGPSLPIAPHSTAGSIVYDPSREYLYATSMNSPTTGTVTVLDGASTSATYQGEAAMSVGQSPIAALVVPSAGLTASSEIWVANSVAGTISLIASSPPNIEDFVAVPQLLDVGQNTTFVLTYSGGAGTSTINYTNLPPGCTSENTVRLICGPTGPGTFTVMVSVTDGLGDIAGATTNVTVQTGLSISVSILPPPPYFPLLVVGQSFGMVANATGGTPPYAYDWSFGDGIGTTGHSVTHAYSNVGTYLLRLNVTDRLCEDGADAWAVTVYPAPNVSIAFATLDTDVGVPDNFTAQASGGTGNGTTIWLFGDNSALGQGTSVNHSWPQVGLYNVTAKYEDDLGHEAQSTIQVRVNPSPVANFVVTGGSQSNPARPGTEFQYNATLFEGTGPYSVTWSFGDGSNATGRAVSHAYALAGNFSVNVVARDAVRGEVNATLVVEVFPSVPSNTGGNSSNSDFPLGVFLGVVVGATLATLIVYAAGSKRRKPRRPSPPSPYVPPQRTDWKEG